MTSFSTPFNFKRPFTQTTVMSVDVSGTANIRTDVVVSGNANFHGTLSLGVETTTEASAGGAGGAVPATAEAFAKVDIEGTTYLIPLFNFPGGS